VIIGTPEYLSPEQGQGKEIDTRTDIYSLGIILYEMLTGNLPFKATTAAAMIMSHIHKNPSPMSKYKEGLPPALEAA